MVVHTLMIYRIHVFWGDVRCWRKFSAERFQPQIHIIILYVQRSQERSFLFMGSHKMNHGEYNNSDPAAALNIGNIGYDTGRRNVDMTE